MKAPEATTAPQSINPLRRTVLVVEDNADVAELTCLLLAAAGFRTLHAALAGHGMLLAVTQLPDVILLDVDLPDGDGFHLCRRLKANPVTAQIPVLFCTGRPDACEAALAAGGVACLRKPEDLPTLATTIHWTLDQRGGRNEPQDNTH